ncbi:vanadium-dependent haloperoxidase [Brevibacillus choshinensis]|uniref:vanadium-dependent haloperoxidase n=1 Tax=Brevibacillus choshinensis TaxID=54911 RepID=UPI001EEDBED7|nr:vanadium-dependent haloperoxidase [Brevibacillus choshinensis]
MAYPEGCPTHPSYPAGHACIAGAGITMLKAFSNESFVIPNPVEASPDGLSLLPYSGAPLTLGNELNKLAANIALGRDTAGVHWRSDGIEGLKLGEAVAIGILQDYSNTYHEKFSGFSLTTFDGKTITIG